MSMTHRYLTLTLTCCNSLFVLPYKKLRWQAGLADHSGLFPSLQSGCHTGISPAGQCQLLSSHYLHYIAADVDLYRQVTDNPGLHGMTLIKATMLEAKCDEPSSNRPVWMPTAILTSRLDTVLHLYSQPGQSVETMVLSRP